MKMTAPEFWFHSIFPQDAKGGLAGLRAHPFNEAFGEFSANRFSPCVVSVIIYTYARAYIP